MRSKPGPPMTLAHTRANGVRAVTATCEACGQWSRRQRRRPARKPRNASGQPQASLQPLRRKADQHETGHGTSPDARRSRAVSQCRAPAILGQAFGGHPNASAVI